MFLIESIRASFDTSNKDKDKDKTTISSHEIETFKLFVNGEVKKNFQSPKSNLLSDRSNNVQNPRRKSVESYKSDEIGSLGPRLSAQLPPLQKRVLADEPEAPKKEQDGPATAKFPMNDKRKSVDIAATKSNKEGRQQDIIIKKDRYARSSSDLDIKFDPQQIETKGSRQNLNSITSLGWKQSLSHVPDDDDRIHTNVKNIEVTPKTMESIADRNYEQTKNKTIIDKSKSVNDENRLNSLKGLATNQFKSASFDQKPVEVADFVKLKLKDLAENQTPTPHHKVQKRKFWPSIRFYLKLIVMIAVLYIGVPVGLLFGAANYDDSEVLVNLNFGLLGIFQGLIEIAFLYYLIDLPIRSKIKEIEGSKNGWINIDNYVVVNKVNSALILIFSTGIQIGAGNAIKSLDIRITPVQIFASCLILTAFKGFVWLAVLVFRTPNSIFADKVMIKKELEHIGKIRKEFMQNLRNRKNRIEMIGVPISGEADFCANNGQIAELNHPSTLR